MHVHSELVYSATQWKKNRKPLNISQSSGTNLDSPVDYLDKNMQGERSQTHKTCTKKV